MTSVSLFVRNVWPSRVELGNQLLVVVDLAVVDDADAAVLVVQRLLTGREIDDRQPLVAEPDAGLDVHALFVGAAMMLRVVHAREHVAADLAPPAAIEDAGYSAHGFIPVASASRDAGPRCGESAPSSRS